MQSFKRQTLYVEPTAIKQIAGRAGRLSSNYKVGLVTAWQETDLAYVRAVMAHDVPQIESAGVYPSVEQIQSFSESLSKINEITLPAEVVEDGETTAQGDRNDPEAVAAEAAAQAEWARETDSAGKDRSSLAVPQPETLGPVKVRLSQILDKFVQLSQVDKRFHMCNHRDMMIMANWLHPIPLSLPDR